MLKLRLFVCFYHLTNNFSVDNTPPTCRPNPISDLDVTMEIPLELRSSVVNFQEPNAVDNCGAVILDSRSHSPGDSFNVGDTQVRYTFRDTSGNMVTCSLTITVRQGIYF